MASKVSVEVVSADNKESLPSFNITVHLARIPTRFVTSPNCFSTADFRVLVSVSNLILSISAFLALASRAILSADTSSSLSTVEDACNSKGFFPAFHAPPHSMACWRTRPHLKTGQRSPAVVYMAAPGMLSRARMTGRPFPLLWRTRPRLRKVDGCPG